MHDDENDLKKNGLMPAVYPYTIVNHFHDDRTGYNSFSSLFTYTHYTH